ncbi:MAG: hypothetical protein LBL96_04130 [Clostridiales bacterium]|jgi:hypothetical protein|nr:hypothetical protein [Clostridiales bacterium]
MSGLLMLLITLILAFLYVVLDTIIYEKIEIERNIASGLALLVCVFIIVSGCLFGLDTYSLRLCYLIVGFVAIAIIAFCKFVKKRTYKFEPVAYKRSDLIAFIAVIIVGCLLTANKFGYNSMGSDDGVYAAKAIVMSEQTVRNQVDLQSLINGNATATAGILSNDNNVYPLVGFYKWADNHQGLIKPTQPALSTLSGYFHGLPTLPAVLSISYKIFGVEGIANVQSVFYIMSIALVFLTLRKNIKLSLYCSTCATLLFSLVPSAIWLSKGTLTENGLTTLFCYLLSQKSDKVYTKRFCT